MNHIKTNTLVVGQGLAGTLVAYNLYLHKIPFLVIDPGLANTCSRIAAGMFTPVSGRRKTIHPLVARQILLATDTYKAIGVLTGSNILHLQNIYQVFTSAPEQNDLFAKSMDAGFAKYIIANPVAAANIKHGFGACEITCSGWVDCGLLIESFARWLKTNNALIQAAFLHKDLQHGKGGMRYQGISFKNIIFCEGYQAIDNPFFTNQSLIPCKGDILTIMSEDGPPGRIIKKDGIYLIATGQKKFKAGATYQWNNSKPGPEEAAKKLIELKLAAMLENKFTITDHQSAIRPTTKNREVIAKQHPDHAGMYLLNGLGTKGVLQGPWWAEQLLLAVSF